MKFLRVAASVFVLLLLAGFALAFAVYSSYSDLAELNRTAKAKFVDWEAALVPRRNMLAELAEITATYDQQSMLIQREAEEVLSEAPDGTKDVGTRIAMHMLYGNMLDKLRSLAMRYPQLRDSDVYREWETAFLKNEIAVEAASDGYNSAARDYNVVLGSITGKVITLLFNVPEKPLIPG